ncbi:hypothetical protein P8452_35821 [Trifolium repens]|nr:hypothetical protein P8452_35821 [Trifolium repens]
MRKTRDLNISAMIICKLIKHVVPGSQPQINRPFVYSLSRGLSTSNMLLFGWLTDIGSNEGPHMYCRLNLEEKRSHALCAQSSVDVGMKGVSQAVEARNKHMAYGTGKASQVIQEFHNCWIMMKLKMTQDLTNQTDKISSEYGVHNARTRWPSVKDITTFTYGF